MGREAEFCDEILHHTIHPNIVYCSLSSLSFCMLPSDSSFLVSAHSHSPLSWTHFTHSLLLPLLHSYSFRYVFSALTFGSPCSIQNLILELKQKMKVSIVSFLEGSGFLSSRIYMILENVHEIYMKWV